MSARTQGGLALVAQDALDAVAGSYHAAIAVDDGINVAVLPDQVNQSGAGILVDELQRPAVEVDDFALGMIMFTATISKQAVKHIRTDAALLCTNLGMFRKSIQHISPHAGP